MWIDSHCHLDAPEFLADREGVFTRARQAGVTQMVIPAVAPLHFDMAAQLAAAQRCAYALGVHPLWMGADSLHNQREADEQVIQQVHSAWQRYAADPRLVAVGEIGLDYFVEGLNRERQWFFYTEQLKLARQYGYPVILHVRKSADMLLKGLRQFSVSGGIAHAFNGSEQQAQAFMDLGFKLGFGGACTFERARQIRHLAQTLPLQALVLETDAPDMPPQWIYRTAEQRAQGEPQGRNEPAQLPRIAQVIAQLRGMRLDELAEAARENTWQALPKLRQLDGDAAPLPPV